METQAVGAARIWVLLYSRTGDNNQALALAKSLGLPFETKPLDYNRLRDFWAHLGPSLLTLDAKSRASLEPPWPEVVIAIGRWSVPVARWIKRQNGDRTKIIFLGNPRIDPRHFDLILATPDYLFPRGGNVAVISLPAAAANPTILESVEPDWCVDHPRPRILLLVGAPVKYWQLTDEYLEQAVARLVQKSNLQGGSIIACGSPRTPDDLLAAVEQALGGAQHGLLVPSRKGGLDELMKAADEIIVTGDSMAMVTEAIMTAKPVGILPLELNRKGRLKLGLESAPEGSASRRRDLRRFWEELWAKGLAGTIEEPRSAKVASSAESGARIASAFLDLESSSGRPVVNAAAVGRARKQNETKPYPAVGFATLANLLVSFGDWIQQLMNLAKRDVGALWLATRDPRTPTFAKLIAGGATASALSPIDLTPDFIPVLGYLDDVILLVFATLLAVRLIPKPLMADLRSRARSIEFAAARQGATAMVAVWLVAATVATLRLGQLGHF